MHDERNATHLHWLPLLAVLKQYPRAWFRHDLVAGLSTYVVMIPSPLSVCWQVR